MKIFDDKNIDFERYFDITTNSFDLIMSDKMDESNESKKGKEEKLSLRDKIILTTSGLLTAILIGSIVYIFETASTNEKPDIEMPKNPTLYYDSTSHQYKDMLEEDSTWTRSEQ